MNKNIILLLTSIFVFVGTLYSSASTRLISDIKQLYTNAPDPDYPLINLIDDRDQDTKFRTSDDYTEENHYLTVQLPEDFSMEDGDNLVVVLTRPNREIDGIGNHTVRNPTAMDVYFSFDGTNYNDSVLCRVYFTYRGSGTTELSEHLPFKNLNERIAKVSEEGKTINDVKALKFVVTMNNGKYTIGEKNDIRPMLLAGFQIYQVKAGEPVVDHWVDRYHLDTDINYRYYDYTFEHTQGVLHPANRKKTGTNGEKSLEELEGWENFTKDDDGIWTADTAYLNKYKIRMPDYSFITMQNDTIDKLITNPNLKLQRTATVEHVVYAVQGEPIALQPFYTLPYVENYKENFIHWYDYTTGGQVTDDNHTELLDFNVDASGVFRSKDHGWYTSPLFKTDVKDTTVKPFKIRTVVDYKEFVRQVNELGLTGLQAELLDDLDFKGETVSPIGTSSNPWCGKFVGNNNVLKNLTIDNYWVGSGIFGSVTDGALIENLIIDKSCSIKGGSWVGVVGMLRDGGTLTIQGVVNHADVKANSGNVGGILGGVQSGPSKNVDLNINNCAFTGHVSNNNNESTEIGLLAGWIGRGAYVGDPIKIKINFKNIIITGSQNRFESGKEIYRYSNDYINNFVFNVNLESCYDVNGRQNWNKFDISNVNSDSFLYKFNEEWKVGDFGFPMPKEFKTKLDDIVSTKSGGVNPDRKYGTYATFMHPRDPFAESGNLRQLCKDEFVIAADMAQGFSIEDNINDTEGKIIEPVIQFRHIFRVKDGKKFADENMADEEGNRKFIRKNLRHITATANTAFQVRLDYPYPVEQTTRGVFYYKIDDTDYRRICSRYFRVYKDGKLIQDRDEESGKMWFKENGVKKIVDKQEEAIFYASAMFDGQGVREVDGINYYLCGGGGHFYRMMSCNSNHALEGRYAVQVVGTDYDGHTIKLADSPDVDLLVQEFQITFLPEMSSILCTEEELNTTFKEVSNENLTHFYGEPSDKIDFDEYRYLETAENLPSGRPDWYITTINSNVEEEKHISGNYFRWPVSWEQSNYGFGYNVRNDYAMQMIVNNQAITPYHSLGIVVDKETDNFGKGEGLHDRLFYDTKGDQKGYFYYVNAADDPGIIARLKLDTFCFGSKIHVSCWISEFSHSEESANLSFNFVARLKNGERIPLHSHITGYVQQKDASIKEDKDFTRRGRWMYVYSSFVPILTDKDFDMSELSHYEVELDNNAKSSGGADYAIDDIRVYTVRPLVYADQLSPVCMESSSIDVRLSADFEVLMQSIEVEETEDPKKAEKVDLYYAFLDKKKYDRIMEKAQDDDEVTYEEAFNQSVLRFKYDGINDSYYGHLQFYTCFDKHTPYDQTNSNNQGFAFRTKENGRRLIVFNANANDKTMLPGKEYIAVLLTKPAGTIFVNGDPDAKDFNVEDKCTKKCVLTVQSSHVIKIDGAVQKQSDEIDACRNQSPVVQVDLYAPVLDDKGEIIPGETKLVEKNAVFDWFDGPMDEFVEIKDPTGTTSLWEALQEFRRYYPEAENLNDEPKEDYTQTMKDLIAEYSKIDPEGKIRARLILAQSSYAFPPLELPLGQTQRDAYVLAVPIPKMENDKLVLICTQPTEVHIVVKQRAPRLAQGIHAIKYPEVIDDVPLRISLKQLEEAKSDKPLVLPFRTIAPVTESVTDMKLPYGGSEIVLAVTNDPDLKDLQGEDKEDNELWSIGEVVELVANKDNVDDGYVALKFWDNIKFREGYEYRLRFLFEEDAPQGTDITDICSGHVLFTLKVVPEYQEWTGAKNLNWNNDDNWRRVSSDDIWANSSDAKYKDYVTDGGSNDREFSYAPLDFTKVVIPHGETVPELFDAAKENVSDAAKKNVSLKDKTYPWNDNPSSSENLSIGDATTLVQYDMVQRVEDDGTYCKPWLAHWCDQIHFESGAEIGKQQFLNYDKAWVDMEVSPTRWYTLSSPLQGVVAGDMYLPSDNARQNTTYFEDITFNTKDYNRFKPAVFQRSWNLASAIVYNYNDNPNNTTDVKVETTWSNVYNDVRVPYTAGHGFSIKTDLAGVDTGVSDTGEPKKVKFRLPKADTSYSYYTDGGDNGDLTQLTRPNPYWLNEVEGTIMVEAATDNNKLFLVGNPFMAHMDIAKFLKENSDVISPKYWILDGDHQGAAVMGDAEDLTGTLDNPKYVAPMQGFFVEAINPGKKLVLNYNADMAVTVNDNSSLTGVLTRSGETNPTTGLRISTIEGGSSALILFDDRADCGYNSDEDVMFVSDATLEAEALVYTVADGTATTINALPGIESTEIGVISKDEQPVTLVFDGVDSSLGLMLYDSKDNSYEDLYDGMEVRVDGSASRRLYIVNGLSTEVDPELEIILMGHSVRILSSVGNLSARVYDVNGRLIDSDDRGDDEAFFNLDKGIYVIEAWDDVSRKTEKVLIK